jgi:NAD(P)-dependent dehydrogenase (short-subunit alcohol dehydrogenase family)
LAGLWKGVSGTLFFRSDVGACRVGEWDPRRGYSAYVATKAGLGLLIKLHAMELAPHKINGISPRFVYTEMIRHVMEDDTFRQGFIARIPIGRRPQDIVGPALFFMSSASVFVTGQNLLVDGGITASR